MYAIRSYYVSLGNMATISTENGFAVSTVGVGSDFNEHLMTYIADRGAGNYYYLENPNLFAEVFLKEFKITRAAAATSVEVRIPLRDGLTVVDASGYPIQMKNGQAVIQQGNFRITSYNVCYTKLLRYLVRNLSLHALCSLLYADWILTPEAYRGCNINFCS